MTCSVKGCGKAVHSKGMCGAHYQRMRRTGSTDPTDRAVALTLTGSEQFWRRVDQSGGHDTCWPWTGYKLKTGYGSLKYGADGATKLAHRLAYELAVGPIPAGLEIDHRCHDPNACDLGDACPHRACANPTHLKQVAHRENSNLDRSTAGRRQAAKTHCPQDHEYTEENTYRLGGRRHCRTCHRDRQQARRDARQSYG